MKRKKKKKQKQKVEQKGKVGKMLIVSAWGERNRGEKEKKKMEKMRGGPLYYCVKICAIQIVKLCFLLCSFKTKQ